MTRTDLSLADLAHDHHAVVARLRTEQPVVHSAATDRWLVSRHHLVRAVVDDAATFRSDHPRSLVRRTFGAQMLSTDGAEQRRHRAPYAPVFRPRAVRTVLTASVQERSRQVVEALQPGDDLVHPCAQLAVGTVLDVLGLSAVAGEQTVSRWYDALAAALANVTEDPDVAEAGRAATEAFAHAVHAAGLLRGPAAGLSEQERLSNALLVLFGGIETTQSAILNALWALAQHPREQAAARGDRALLPGVVEESLRWEPSVLTLTRFTSADVVLSGVVVPADSVVECLIAGANRDPAVFADPDRFDPRRPNAADHLTFGAGQHFCLGAHLARLEAVSLLEALLDRAPDGFGFTRPDPPPPCGHEFRHPPELRLSW